MRILHLVHVRWWNASAQYAIHLAAAQQREGHEVCVWTAEGEPPAEHAKKLGLQVIERPLSLQHTPSIFRELRAMAADYDVVNAHHADVQNLALLAFAAGKRPALVRTRVDVRDAKKSVFNRYLYNHRLDAVIVPGEESRQRYIQNLGIDPKQVVTVYGGVDHERFRRDERVRAQERARMGLTENDVAFGLVGRLGAIKGPEYYLEAAAAVHAANPRAKFFVAGKAASGHTIEEYQAVAKRFGDAGVKFLGYVQDVPALLNALDVGVITSVGSEAHCRVGLEMMSAGLPVVGTDIGVIPEVVSDGETGYIVRSRNARELAVALGRLASDDALRGRLASQARRRIEAGFTFSKWVQRTMDVYQKAEQARWT